MRLNLGPTWIVRFASLCAAVHSARGDSDDGVVLATTPAPPGWADPGPPRHARVRSKPRLMRSDQDGKVVVIVGGGYAGWGAAHRLVEGGMKARDITILEADATFGGRAQTDRDFMPFPLDLGPSYVPDGGRLRGELAALAGVAVEDLPLKRHDGVNGWYLWRDGETYHDFLAKNIIAKLDMCKSKTECRKRAKGMGFKFKKGVSHEGAYGCYSRNKKAFWGGGAKKEDYTHRLSDVHERINCDKIHKEYGCQVEFVDYSEKAVITDCKNGKRFNSTQVIVTVPLSVLKDDDIQFDPKLPAAVQQNVDERAWFRGFKLFLEFDQSFRPQRSVSFGDAYHWDPDAGKYTGEHFMWDYTRYAAPEFKGERNLVGGYFIGSTADDFDGMNETEIVAETLSKFEDEYRRPCDDCGYTRGYHPDSYQRHLLVHWENPDVKPFVRGTHSGPSRTFGGHRADNKNRIFFAGEAFPAPVLEFCTSPMSCYYSMMWSGLPEEIQEAYAVLGWKEEVWDKSDHANYPDTTGMYWEELSGVEREAVALIGYTQDTWDQLQACNSTPKKCYHSKYWAELPTDIEESYVVLGFTEDIWNDGGVTDAWETAWGELTLAQQQAALHIGYTPDGWDKRLGLSVKAAADVEYEEEGWVYTALHSGQKAAETILALQTWTDLFPAEDFGTYGGTLGVFQACNEDSAYVKTRKKDDFFLELKAGPPPSCAKTRHLELSGRATKLRIQFRLRAVEFADGDFFSVGIAANAANEYQQVLNAGTDTPGTGASGDGGILEHANIPRNKKWFPLKRIRSGGKGWLVIELKDLGAADVNRISLQFSHHAAYQNTSKIQLDDVSVQEFVPM